MTDKKAFLLYADLLESIDYLNDEDLGKFFRAILYLQNGKSFEIPANLKMGFEFIKTQFSRDEKAYKKVLKGKSAGGKASGEARRLKREMQNEQEATKRTSVQFVEQNEQVEQERTNSTKRTDSVSDSVSDIISSLRSEMQISENLWKDWKDHMKSKKANLTKKRESLQLKKLKVLCESLGKSATELIELAIEKGWQSFYEERAFNHSTNKSITRQTLDDFEIEYQHLEAEGENALKKLF